MRRAARGSPGATSAELTSVSDSAPSLQGGAHLRTAVARPPGFGRPDRTAARPSQQEEPMPALQRRTSVARHRIAAGVLAGALAVVLVACSNSTGESTAAPPGT